MKKIIHLSDTHVGYGNLERRFAILARKIIEKTDDPNDYIIVLTGDIIDDATEEENEEKVYEEAIVHIRGLEKAGFKVFCCPGNHDYGSGAIGNKKYVPIFKKAFYGDENVPYPISEVVGSGENSIAFIGLDSMAEELHWYDRLGADGEIGKKQLTRLEQKLNDPNVTNAKYLVVYLHHHPFAPRFMHKLKDASDLREILKNSRKKVDMLLFGHNHDGYYWHGCWGINRVYDAGSSIFKKSSPGPHRIIDLSVSDVNEDIWTNFFATDDEVEEIEFRNLGITLDNENYSDEAKLKMKKSCSSGK